MSAGAVARPSVLSWLAAASCYVAGAAVALALKIHFSGAGADQLRWVLGPTCWLAGQLGGMTFEDEAGAGFISHADRLVVGAPCSGVNFLIVCFAALFFGYARRFQSIRGRAAWLLGCLIMAYAATVAVNAVRVVVAARLYRADVYDGLLTPARAHRLMGTLLYCGALVMVHGVAGRLAATLGGDVPARPVRPQVPAWLLQSPLVWYLAVAVGVPVFRLRAGSLDARLAEHLLTVVGVAAALALLVTVATTLADRIKWSRSGGRSTS